MNKIRIAHLINHLETVGYSRTVLDILTRSNQEKYQFLLIAGRRPAAVARDSVVVIPELGKTLSFWNSLKTVFRIRRILREWRPDILHVHSLKSGWIGTLAGKLSGVPAVIYSSYGFPRNFGKPRKNVRRRYDDHSWNRFWLAMKMPAMFSDFIVAVTPHGLEDELAMKIAPRAKYRVIYNAIQPEFFEKSSENVEVSKFRLGLSDFFPILGTATRLDHGKGMEFLLEAVAQLKSKCPEMILLVMGDGPLRENLIVMANRMGISNQVRFLGLREDVPALLQLLDVFVLPSLYEASGILLAEAMACGKPVVTTHVGGIPELIQEGQNGFLVPPGDVARLALKILQLVRDPELAKRIGENAAAKAKHLFDMRKMINDYEGLYQSLAKRKRERN